MSKMNFTKSQQDAIDARGGSILVSAAAGSGKTRVLVQRVINRITDKENPIDADRMLIVTFTNAAAAEMKSRISAALEDELSKDPNNMSLRRQQILLPRADICTIHSFCSRIIRENFYVLNINQDYRIGNENELSVIKHNVISDIIEEMYAQKRSDFILLSELFSGARSDAGLENTILGVYESSMSHPFPKDWIAESAELYNPNIALSDTVFAKKAFETLHYVLKFIKGVLAESFEVVAGNEAFNSKTESSGINCYNKYEAFVNSLENAEKTRQWSKISDCVSAYKKPSYRKPTSKKIEVSEEECQTVKNCFEMIDNAVSKRLVPLFMFNNEIYTSDTQQIYPVVKCLQEILYEFDERYAQAKNEKGILDFSDLEHLMLKLLVRKADDGYQKTDFAKSLSEQYDEIMIDEYQDTNAAQEFIFRAVSKNESNMFVVGDVKQSIYRFREAMPEIFIKRREKCTLYDSNNPIFPAKIILDKNFRSREGIIDSVNFVFERLMSKRMGEVEYNNEEQLVTGAEYPENNEADFELHIIENQNKNILSSNYDSDCCDLNSDEAEAKYIVSVINKMMNDGTTISDSGTVRKLRYSDFCILMRNLSGHARVFSEILNKNNIPAYTDKPYSLFECYEVNVVLSFLKIVDNPLQDIPMLSVLLCPVFGFTPDELSIIKIKCKRKNIYGNLLDFADFLSENKDKNNKEKAISNKCKNFIDILSYFRNLSVTLSVDRLLDVFLEKTYYLSVISAMKNGKIRVMNLRKLMNFVRDYENSGKGRLTGFIRLISYLEESKTDITAGDTAPADSVKIMSIHHSKGLEFPICIMATTTSRGNIRKDTVMCHSELGFGTNTIDMQNMLKFSTLQRTVIDNELTREGKSEELRVLYVAMTRAKEKLIVVSSFKSDYNETLKKLADKIKSDDGKIIPYAVEQAGTLSDWIIMCALLHPDMKQLREDAGAESLKVIPTKSKWKLFHISNISGNTVEEAESVYTPRIDKNFMEFLKKRFTEKYAFEERTNIPSKVSASALAHNDNKFSFVAKSRPAFVQKNKMTSAERGTALHMFMQYADLKKLAVSADKEKKRIEAQEFMSPEQIASLDDSDIKKFTDSKLFQRMLRAEKIYREYRFTVNISAKDVDEKTDCNDSVILQGAIDCIFVENEKLVITDYKTDRVKDVNELAELYSKQLKLYKNAAQQIFGLPVKECIIYSLHLGEQTVV